MEVQACGGKSISSTASYRYICVDPSEFLEGGGIFRAAWRKLVFEITQLFNGVFQRWGREQDIATSTLGSILGEGNPPERKNRGSQMVSFPANVCYPSLKLLAQARGKGEVTSVPKVGAKGIFSRAFADRFREGKYIYHIYLEPN